MVKSLFDWIVCGLIGKTTSRKRNQMKYTKVIQATDGTYIFFVRVYTDSRWCIITACNTKERALFLCSNYENNKNARKLVCKEFVNNNKIEKGYEEDEKWPEEYEENA